MKSTITKLSDSIKWNDLEITFFEKTFQEQYFTANQVNMQQSKCGWEFTLPATGSPSLLGIMIPINSLEVIVCDTPIEKYRSKQYYYSPTRELESILKLNIRDFNSIESPIIHMISEDVVCSWSCPNECIISTFVSQYQWYINCVSVAWEDLTFFLDESSNFLVNMQRFPSEKKEILINETSSMHVMQQALLSGSAPISHPNRPHNVIRKTRNTQLLLAKHDIESVIIGSLARRLNSIPVDVNDIDLMVSHKEHLHKSIDLIGSFADSVYIKEDSAKFSDDPHIIELCYDNYNILPGKNNIVSRHGLTYLNTEGLLWLYMINLFACNMDEHSDDYRHHILNAICSLHSKTEMEEFSVIAFHDNIPDYSKRCFELCQKLSNMNMRYYDTRINKPFVVRCFQNSKKTTYPIVNLGSSCNAEIIINTVPQKAVWEDIKGRILSINIEPHNEFSVLRIPDVDVPGILECE